MSRLKSALLSLVRLLPDKQYVYVYYFIHKRKVLHLRNPLRFTEKIQWLKVYGGLEQFGLFADKYTVRRHVTNVLGDKHLIPLIGAWDQFDDIPFADLPQQFVLKATHGCGYNYICKDKSSIDYPALRKTINHWLNENFYKLEREPQYKHCRPRIICETYMEDDSGELRDYKIWCSNGEPRIVQLDTERFTDHKSDMYDLDWQKLTYAQVATFGQSQNQPERPQNLDEMIGIAKILSQGFPFVRVDLYSVQNQIYFGELTFTPGSGMVNYNSEEGDIRIGELIDLSEYGARKLKPITRRTRIASFLAERFAS